MIESGHENDLRVRVYRENLIDEFYPTLVGHREIGQNQRYFGMKAAI
jgi:hypothetical protein